MASEKKSFKDTASTSSVPPPPPSHSPKHQRCQSAEDIVERSYNSSLQSKLPPQSPRRVIFPTKYCQGSTPQSLPDRKYPLTARASKATNAATTKRNNPKTTTIRTQNRESSSSSPATKRHLPSFINFFPITDEHNNVFLSEAKKCTTNPSSSSSKDSMAALCTARRSSSVPKMLEIPPFSQGVQQQLERSSSVSSTRSILPWFSHEAETADMRSGIASEQRPRSILKSSPNYVRPDTFDCDDDLDADAVAKISSIESDIPSLASSMGSEGSDSCPLSPLYQNMSLVKCSSTGQQLKRLVMPRPPFMARCASEPARSSIQFSSKVLVREFARSKTELDTTWFSSEEMQGFRCAAMQRIMTFSSQTQLIPTGTGRTVLKRVPPPCLQKILFSHQALRMEADASPAAPSPHLRKTATPSSSAGSAFLSGIAQSEIQKVLVVDSHDICLRLFAQGILKMFPKANVVTATSSEEALRRVESARDGRERGFDVVVVEERLKLFHRRRQQQGATPEQTSSAGSGLLRVLSKTTKTTLFIGVSAHAKVDAQKLTDAGADGVWSKPPPRMDDTLRDSMLRDILVKRSKSNLAAQLFPSSITS